MIDKLVKALMIILFVIAALGGLYLLLGVGIIVVSYIWGIEPVHNFPLLFK